MDEFSKECEAAGNGHDRAATPEPSTDVRPAAERRIAAEKKAEARREALARAATASPQAKEPSSIDVAPASRNGSHAPPSREPGDDSESESAAKAEGDGQFRFKPITAADFFAMRRKHKMLVQRLLVEGEPAVLAGPEKADKTLTALNLAISLSSGKPFLGTFNVYRRRKVCFISGESGPVTLEQAARRQCEAMGEDPAKLNMLLGFDLPQFANPQHVGEIAQGIKEHDIEVIFIDPYYLCLLAGAPDLNAANMFQVGPVIQQFVKACLNASATPIFIHHANKQLKIGEVMTLAHLAYTGLSQFTRQWILLNHRKPWEAEKATARLYMRAGGSAGAGGDWHLDIEEGRLNEQGDGRYWKVAVTTASEGIRVEQEQSDGRRGEQADRRAKANDKRFLDALDTLTFRGGAAALAAVRAKANMGNDLAKDCATRLVGEGIIEQVSITIKSGVGSSAPRQGIGFCRPAKNGTANHPEQTDRLFDGVSVRTDSLTVPTEATTVLSDGTPLGRGVPSDSQSVARETGPTDGTSKTRKRSDSRPRKKAAKRKGPERT